MNYKIKEAIFTTREGNNKITIRTTKDADEPSKIELTTDLGKVITHEEINGDEAELQIPISLTQEKKYSINLFEDDKQIDSLNIVLVEPVIELIELAKTSITLRIQPPKGYDSFGMNLEIHDTNDVFLFEKNKFNVPNELSIDLSIPDDSSCTLYASYLLGESQYHSRGKRIRYTLILHSPQVKYCNIQRTGKVSLEWSKLKDVESYEIGLFLDGVQLQNHGGKITETTGTLEVPPEVGDYLIKVRGIRGVVHGPWSTGLPIIRKIPKGLELYLGEVAEDTQKLMASWEPLADITQYEVALYRNNVLIETLLSNRSTCTFEEVFRIGHHYQARIRTKTETEPEAFGPWSAFAEGPYSSQIRYTYDAQGNLTQVTTLTYQFPNS